MGKAEHSRSLGATGEARVHQTGKEDLDNHVSHLLVLQRLQSVSVISLRQQGGGGGAGARGGFGQRGAGVAEVLLIKRLVRSSNHFQFITSCGVVLRVHRSEERG